MKTFFSFFFFQNHYELKWMWKISQQRKDDECPASGLELEFIIEI